MDSQERLCFDQYIKLFDSNLRGNSFLLYVIIPSQHVGGDIVMRPFVCGWVSEWVRESVRACVSPSRFALWTRYRLQFLSDHFHTSHVICSWWEEEPYWFSVTGSKAKVKFGTLSIKPCGHDTDNSFLPNHLTSNVSCSWWEEEPYWFWVTG